MGSYEQVDFKAESPCSPVFKPLPEYLKWQRVRGSNGDEAPWILRKSASSYDLRRYRELAKRQGFALFTVENYDICMISGIMRERAKFSGSRARFPTGQKQHGCSGNLNVRADETKLNYSQKYSCMRDYFHAGAPKGISEA
ncbi:MAG: hypothetical protein WCH43_08875 [Verrucomicrobiota bacterium]